ncbi:HAD domain-containing protein [Jatrophihabitans sp. GAS493]|uniref:HAD domain-containing protein n=1 Tax=Jatrophihabitans sp. GAS493 TaxID=1907575 RepID=UPI0012FE655A|nr:HAD domain-containing protein [Jatrophihabitans sp. GAS493]
MSELPPVWLLDVDGVVNATASRGDRTVWPLEAWHRDEVTDLDGDVYPVLYADPVLNFLRVVHERGAAEVRWHTTWQHSAPQRLAAALGLPDWPVAVAPEFTDKHDSGYEESGWVPVGARWWKLGAAVRVGEQEGRRLVWTDDDLNAERRWPGSELREYLKRADLLAVSPPSNVGLTPKNLRTVAAFLDL